MLGNFKKRIMALMMIVLMCTTVLPGMTVRAATRDTDVKKASKGNILVGVSGEFEYVSRTKILKRINEIRKEACNKGYKNPSTGKKLKKSDYVEMKWSSALEWIAQTRAAESTVYEGHTRPNGQSCFSTKYKNEQGWAEDLAWNYSGLMAGIEQWYGEKEAWIAQDKTKVTGHYTSLINPRYKYIGIGCFRRTTGGWYGVAAQLTSDTYNGTSQNKISGKYTQKIEVLSERLSSIKIKGADTVKIGKQAKYSVTGIVRYPGILGGENETTASVAGTITWKSSKTSVATMSNGKLTAKKKGTTTISAKLSNGKTIKKTVKVQ